VMIPTYNEVDNIQLLIRQIFSLKIPNLNVLFIDDNSPDKTGKLIKSLVEGSSRVFLIEREKKLGVGSAHMEGIKWAYKNGYGILITMDADLTHSPKYIQKLIKAPDKFDLVIASRYLSRNSMIGWSRIRRITTFINHLMIKFLFKVDNDVSNAFRLYRLDRISEDVFNLVQSKGYSFFFESLIIMKVNNIKIGEVSVVMHDRRFGESKMRFLDVWKQISIMAHLFFENVFWGDKLVVKNGKNI